MRLVLYLLGVALALGIVKAQCPPNVTSLFAFNDRTFSLPLTIPLCFFCRFLDNDGNRLSFNDGLWSTGGTTLTNGSFNGNVTLTSTDNTMYISLTYPDAVIVTGDTIRCSSVSLGRQHIITIGAFVFLNPTVSPNGTVDFIEGSNQALTCSNPGNTGSPRYVWINDSSGSELTEQVNTSPLVLTLNNVNRTISGGYTCSSTHTDLQGVTKTSSVTVNVQYLDTPSISPVSSTLPQSNGLNITCSFVANPPVNLVTWYHNGTVLDPDSFSHISVNNQTSSSQLVFSSLSRGLMDSGDYSCTVNNTVLGASSSTVSVTVQVNPDSVISLSVNQITTTSVRVFWSLGFNGNADLTGGNVNYAAIANGAGTGTLAVGTPYIERVVTGLEPFTNYSFTVIVTNVAGNSEEETVFAKTLPLVPTAPRLDSVTPINSTALQVSWTNMINTSTQSMVESYRMVYNEEGQATIERNITAPTTSVIISSLSKGTRYTVRVYATNSAGESLVSSSITSRTDIDPPDAVSTLILTPYPNSICVSWTQPTDNGGQDITGYRVYIKTDTASTFNLTDSPSRTTRSILLRPLLADTKYNVMVAAVNMEGGHGTNTSETSTTGTEFSEDEDADLMVIDSSVTALTAAVNWMLPSDTYQSVLLQYRLNGTEWSSDKEMNVTGRTMYNFTGLTPETTYEVRLILMMSSGSCLQRVSNTVTFTTIELQVVVEPSNTTVTAGEQVVLVCNLDTGGAPPNSVTWTFNGGSNLPDSATPSGNRLTLTNTNVDDSGNYTCTFRDTSYTFPLIINPMPTTAAPSAFEFPDYAIYAIAGVVGAIIVVFIIVLILVVCCICCRRDEKDITIAKLNKRSDDRGMWMDEGASGFAPTSTYRRTGDDNVDYPLGRGRSLTNDVETATSFDTIDKDRGKGSREKLTPDQYTDVQLSSSGGLRSKGPYDDQRVEYATVGSSTFSKNDSRHTDV